MKSIRGKSVLTALAALVSLSAISLSVLPAQAATTDLSYTQKLQQMSFITDGHPSVALLDKQVSEESLRTGKTKEEILDLAYTAAVEALPGSVLENHRTPTSILSSQLRRGGDGTHNSLADAQYPGDIFVSNGNNWRNIIVHGHAGIFISSTRCIEAPGKGATVRNVDRHYTVAAGQAVLQHVNTTQESRLKAVARAKTYLGRPYNEDFVRTNRDDKFYMNCGQVVWASYIYGAGFDIAPGAYYIYPFTIRDSSWVKTYKTVNP